ncbi:phage tail-collar fiber domain-containing protein [Enterobacter hormaechei]|uniref:phage tail-collar fiber domain-containing protein n=1 Tax=Enterobacter hormaechei TaxID=158836 RepID=UPI003F6900A5
MATKYYALLTNVGAAKLANATALGEQVEITQMAVGDGNGALPTPNPAQTALVHELRRAPLNTLTIDPVNTNQIIAEQVIPEDVGGWWIREIGLYDSKGDLIAIANCAETYKPLLQEGSGRMQVIRVILIVSSTQAVTLKIDPSVVLATRQYVDDQIIQVKAFVDQQLAAHIAAADPHKQYAPKASPALTGTPTAPTAAQTVNNTQIATTEFVKSAIAALVASSPAALDTLNELAAALGNDPNFATTVTNALAGKQPLDSTLTDLSGKTVNGILQYLGLKSATGADSIGIGDTTVGDILKQNVYVVVISGQSNAQGANTGGPNPASDKVTVWDGATNSWGSSDYTKAPFSRSTPNGNSGNNNIGLAFAHRLVDEHKASKVYVIYDAVGGRPISDWVGNGTDSVRYAAIKAKVEAALATPELVAAGKTKIDFLIWAQGEEDALTDTVTVYRDKFAILDKQFRAESWVEDITPMFVMGMSGLHTRYQVWQAQLNYCENYNRNCIYVNSAGLKTQYDVDGTGDYTHWLGESLWEHGYYRIWEAMSSRGVTHRQQLSPFYSRAQGPWSGQADAIALFSSLVSVDSATSKFPPNAVAATGSISWGYQCSADGNYALAGGYQVSTDNLASYSAGWGREIVFGSSASYCASFGYQNVLNQWAQFAAGRGHNLQHQYETALGRYSKYTTVQDNPVLFQLGCGLTGAAKNAITVRGDGTAEIFTGTRHDPAQEKEIVFEYLSDTKLKLKMLGTDGTVRSVTLTLS